MPSSFLPLLDTLDRPKYKAFHKLIKNNLKDHHTALLEFLYKDIETYLHWTDKKIAARFAAKQKWSNTPKAYGAFRKWKMHLKQQLEAFLLSNYLEEDVLLRQYLLANMYYSNQLHDSFEKTQGSLQKEVEYLPTLANAAFPRSVLRAQSHHLDYYSVTNTNAKTDVSKLIRLTESAERQFLLHRFFLQVETTIHYNTFSALQKAAFDPLAWEAYRKEMHRKATHWPLMAWLLGVFEAYTNWMDTIDFEQLFREFQTYQAELEQYEQQMTMKLLLNVAHRFLDLHPPMYARKIFPMYVFCFAQNLLPNQGFIEGPVFMNIAIIALLSGEYEWYQSFVENYQNSLIDKDRQNVLDYCEAYYYYQLGQRDRDELTLEKALQQLRKMKIINPAFGVRSRTLEARIRYEIDQEHFESTIMLLKRNLKDRGVLSQRLIQRYQNFTRLALHLDRIRRLKNVQRRNVITDEITTLLKAIEAESKLVFSFWLKQKVEEL
ncbi:MAG: hypothetical protein AAF798_01365 [Bacteroidota bacterium]